MQNESMYSAYTRYVNYIVMYHRPYAGRHAAETSMHVVYGNYAADYYQTGQGHFGIICAALSFNHLLCCFSKVLHKSAVILSKVI